LDFAAGGRIRKVEGVVYLRRGLENEVQRTAKPKSEKYKGHFIPPPPHLAYLSKTKTDYNKKRTQNTGALMIHLSRIVCLILCLELMLSPLGRHSFIASAQEATECPKGLSYNSTLNRCLTSPEIARIHEATKSCGGDRKCYQNNASRELNNSSDVKEKDNFFKNDKGQLKGLPKAANAAAISIPLLILIKTMLHRRELKKKGLTLSCSPLSLNLMYAAAGVLALGEVTTWLTHNGKLKKMRESWEKIVSPDEKSQGDQLTAQATEAQSQAFEILAQNEESIAQTAKTKLGFYAAATALFSASALAAAWEMIQLKIAKAAVASNPADLNAANTIMRLTCASNLEASKKVAREDLARERDLHDQEQLKLKMQSQSTPVQELKKTDIKPLEIKTPTIPAPAPAPAPAPKPKPKPKPKPVPKVPSRPMPYLPGKEPKKPDLNNPLIKQLYHNSGSMLDGEKFKFYAINEVDTSWIVFENYLKSYHNSELKVSQSLDERLVRLLDLMIIETAHAEAPAQEETKGPPEKVSNLFDIFNILKKGVKSKDGTPIPIDKINQIENEMNSKFSKFIYNPTTRLAINGALGGWMGIMSAHMNNQQKISQERVTKLRQMRDEFQSARGVLACTPEERNNPGNPRCYCFTENNQVNASRSKSQICNMAAAGLAQNDASTAQGMRTCVDVNFGLDQSCSCRDRKGPDGKNTCLRAGGGFNFSGMSPGMFRMLGAGMGASNDLFSGNLGAADLDAGSLESNAAKIQRAAEEMVSKNSPGELKQAKKYEEGMSQSLVASGAGLSMPGAEGAMSSLPSNPQDAVAQLSQELKKDEAPEVAAVPASAPGSMGSSAEEKLEFGLSEGEALKQESEIAEVMKENLDMGNNDVNNSSTSNIFEVLSLRYKKSALRRLFDEEGKTQADAPASGDIAE
jgi:hypothetical protein